MYAADPIVGYGAAAVAQGGDEARGTGIGDDSGYSGCPPANVNSTEIVGETIGEDGTVRSLGQGLGFIVHLLWWVGWELGFAVGCLVGR